MKTLKLMDEVANPMGTTISFAASVISINSAPPPSPIDLHHFLPHTETTFLFGPEQE
ncbi:hypothetical protein HanXRQr2_Chr07g0289601 [Helianthus annuus]|uniref:Uncharacterized protein n=1 Tax=Helianthus annuus TaxID=4232 RepID=A0A251UUG1_HELAN|nr:hypothetical protein HanXRQr2_Chr07g0289601 [Helianthus annuus]KAJ0904279.1 hypothetical protein HanPSC8_Chr07g0280281 [Helianthus annuus]